MENKMGSQFTNFWNGEYLQTTLTGMGHPIPDTPVATDKSVTCITINVLGKKWQYREINVRLYLVRDCTKQGYFHICCKPGKEKKILCNIKNKIGPHIIDWCTLFTSNLIAWSISEKLEIVLITPGETTS